MTVIKQVVATLTEVRKDGMQKWERTELPKSDQMRYIWLNAYHSKKGIEVGAVETLEFVSGTGGMVGGHWAGWKVVK